jgi:BCCT family betaine/carnitine transporter
MKEATKIEKSSLKVDSILTIVPVAVVAVLCIILTLLPGTFENALPLVQSFIVNDIGFVYMIADIVFIAIALWVAFSKYGNIKLGNLEKPRYNTLSWAGMIFSSTMAADMLYWAMIEWIFYYQSAPFGIDPASRTVAQTQSIVSSYPLFHWGPMSWIWFVFPAVIVGFMMFVKKRSNETISEACRPVFGNRVDGWVGKIIDLFCITSIIIACGIFFRIGTPVITSLISNLTGLPDNHLVTVTVVLITAVIYTFATIAGMKAIKIVSDTSVLFYVTVALIYFFCGPMRFIIESAFSSLGYIAQNYFVMSTWTDPLRVTADAGGVGFPQQWTVYFNANWLSVMCSVPFFIAKISEGRTLRNTIVGGVIGGVTATWFSFVIYGNYSIFQQMTGVADYLAMAEAGYTEAQIIVEIVKTLPVASIVTVLTIWTMIGLFATTFDANCLVLGGFCQRNRKLGQSPSKGILLFWALVIAIVPISMTLADTVLSQLQTIMVLIAIPMLILLVIMTVGFFRDLKKIDINVYDPQKEIDTAIFDD